MFIPMAAAEGAAEFHGTSKSTTETVVGTVTVYAPGKRIEVMMLALT